MLVEISCLLFGLALAVVSHFTFFPIKEWYYAFVTLLFFIAGYIICLILIFGFYFIVSAPIDIKKEYKKPSHFYRFLYVQALQFISFHAHVRLKFIGKDHLPKGKRFVIVCNHRSNFDPMLISMKLYNFDIAWISKVANFHYPLVGKVITRLCYMAIDRNDFLQSLSVIRRATDLVKNDVCSVGVFPEGKRQTEKPLDEFHEGVFNVAIKSDAPLVVATIKGPENIHRNFLFKRTKVVVEIIRVFQNEEINELPAKTLSDMVSKMMFENLNK